MRQKPLTSWHFARPELARHHLQAFDKSLVRLGRALKLGRAVDRSVPQNALKRLRERQILIQTAIGAYRFEDETFKEWVQAARG